MKRPSSQERRASDLILSVLASLGARGAGEPVEHVIDHLRAMEADLQERNHQFAIKGVCASQGNRRRLRALTELLARYRGLERALAALDKREPGSVMALGRAVAAVRSGIAMRHSLYRQSLVVPKTFESTIDPEGLRALVDHAARVWSVWNNDNDEGCC